jgi:uracil DNA glycosylase
MEKEEGLSFSCPPQHHIPLSNQRNIKALKPNLPSWDEKRRSLNNFVLLLLLLLLLLLFVALVSLNSVYSQRKP